VASPVVGRRSSLRAPSLFRRKPENVRVVEQCVVVRKCFCRVGTIGDAQDASSGSGTGFTLALPLRAFSYHVVDAVGLVLRWYVESDVSIRSKTGKDVHPLTKWLWNDTSVVWQKNFVRGW